MAIIKPRRIQVRVQSCECLIRGGLVSFFLRCPEKSKGNSLKCDTAQLRTAVFFPYLINKNTPPLLCVCVLRRRWWLRVFSFAAALFLWQPRISSAAAWLKRQESGTSVWVCGYVSLTSIALFHQWELDLTMPSSILMWSQEDFAAARISSPHQPRGESSVCLAKLMMSGRDSWLVSSRAAWGKFHGYTSLMKTYNEPYFLSLPSLYCLSLSPSTKFSLSGFSRLALHPFSLFFFSPTSYSWSSLKSLLLYPPPLLADWENSCNELQKKCWRFERPASELHLLLVASFVESLPALSCSSSCECQLLSHHPLLLPLPLFCFSSVHVAVSPSPSLPLSASGRPTEPSLPPTLSHHKPLFDELRRLKRPPETEAMQQRCWNSRVVKF